MSDPGLVPAAKKAHSLLSSLLYTAHTVHANADVETRSDGFTALGNLADFLSVCHSTAEIRKAHQLSSDQIRTLAESPSLHLKTAVGLYENAAASIHKSSHHIRIPSCILDSAVITVSMLTVLLRATVREGYLRLKAARVRTLVQDLTDLCRFAVAQFDGCSNKATALATGASWRRRTMCRAASGQNAVGWLASTRSSGLARALHHGTKSATAEQVHLAVADLFAHEVAKQTTFLTRSRLYEGFVSDLKTKKEEEKEDEEEDDAELWVACVALQVFLAILYTGREQVRVGSHRSRQRLLVSGVKERLTAVGLQGQFLRQLPPAEAWRAHHELARRERMRCETFRAARFADQKTPNPPFRLVTGVQKDTPGAASPETVDERVRSLRAIAKPDPRIGEQKLGLMKSMASFKEFITTTAAALATGITNDIADRPQVASVQKSGNPYLLPLPKKKAYADAEAERRKTTAFVPGRLALGMQMLVHVKAARKGYQPVPRLDEEFLQECVFTNRMLLPGFLFAIHTIKVMENTAVAGGGKRAVREGNTAIATACIGALMRVYRTMDALEPSSRLMDGINPKTAANLLESLTQYMAVYEKKDALDYACGVLIVILERVPMAYHGADTIPIAYSGQAKVGPTGTLLGDLQQPPSVDRFGDLRPYSRLLVLGAIIQFAERIDFSELTASRDDRRSPRLFPADNGPDVAKLLDRAAFVATDSFTVMVSVSNSDTVTTTYTPSRALAYAAHMWAMSMADIFANPADVGDGYDVMAELGTVGAFAYAATPGYDNSYNIVYKTLLGGTQDTPGNTHASELRQSMLAFTSSILLTALLDEDIVTDIAPKAGTVNVVTVSQSPHIHRALKSLHTYWSKRIGEPYETAELMGVAIKLRELQQVSLPILCPLLEVGIHTRGWLSTQGTQFQQAEAAAEQARRCISEACKDTLYDPNTFGGVLISAYLPRDSQLGIQSTQGTYEHIFGTEQQLALEASMRLRKKCTGFLAHLVPDASIVTGRTILIDKNSATVAMDMAAVIGSIVAIVPADMSTNESVQTGKLSGEKLVTDTWIGPSYELSDRLSNVEQLLHNCLTKTSGAGDVQLLSPLVNLYKEGKFAPTLRKKHLAEQDYNTHVESSVFEAVAADTAGSLVTRFLASVFTYGNAPLDFVMSSVQDPPSLLRAVGLVACSAAAYMAAPLIGVDPSLMMGTATLQAAFLPSVMTLNAITIGSLYAPSLVQEGLVPPASYFVSDMSTPAGVLNSGVTIFNTAPVDYLAICAGSQQTYNWCVNDAQQAWETQLTNSKTKSPYEMALTAANSESINPALAYDFLTATFARLINETASSTDFARAAIVTVHGIPTVRLLESETRNSTLGRIIADIRRRHPSSEDDATLMAYLLNGWDYVIGTTPMPVLLYNPLREETIRIGAKMTVATAFANTITTKIATASGSLPYESLQRLFELAFFQFMTTLADDANGIMDEVVAYNLARKLNPTQAATTPDSVANMISRVFTGLRTDLRRAPGFLTSFGTLTVSLLTHGSDWFRNGHNAAAWAQKTAQLKAAKDSKEVLTSELVENKKSLAKLGDPTKLEADRVQLTLEHNNAVAEINATAANASTGADAAYAVVMKIFYDEYQLQNDTLTKFWNAKQTGFNTESAEMFATYKEFAQTNTTTYFETFLNFAYEALTRGLERENRRVGGIVIRSEAKATGWTASFLEESSMRPLTPDQTRALATSLYAPADNTMLEFEVTQFPRPILFNNRLNYTELGYNAPGQTYESHPYAELFNYIANVFTVLVAVGTYAADAAKNLVKPAEVGGNTDVITTIPVAFSRFVEYIQLAAGDITCEQVFLISDIASGTTELGTGVDIAAVLGENLHPLLSKLDPNLTPLEKCTVLATIFHATGSAAENRTERWKFETDNSVPNYLSQVIKTLADMMPSSGTTSDFGVALRLQVPESNVDGVLKGPWNGAGAERSVSMTTDSRAGLAGMAFIGVRLTEGATELRKVQGSAIPFVQNFRDYGGETFVTITDETQSWLSDRNAAFVKFEEEQANERKRIRTNASLIRAQTLKTALRQQQNKLRIEQRQYQERLRILGSTVQTDRRETLGRDIRKLEDQITTINGTISGLDQDISAFQTRTWNATDRVIQQQTDQNQDLASLYGYPTENSLYRFTGGFASAQATPYSHYTMQMVAGGAVVAFLRYLRTVELYEVIANWGGLGLLSTVARVSLHVAGHMGFAAFALGAEVAAQFESSLSLPGHTDGVFVQSIVSGASTTFNLGRFMMLNLVGRIREVASQNPNQVRITINEACVASILAGLAGELGGGTAGPVLSAAVVAAYMGRSQLKRLWEIARGFSEPKIPSETTPEITRRTEFKKFIYENVNSPHIPNVLTALTVEAVIFGSTGADVSPQRILMQLALLDNIGVGSSVQNVVRSVMSFLPCRCGMQTPAATLGSAAGGITPSPDDEKLPSPTSLRSFVGELVRMASVVTLATGLTLGMMSITYAQSPETRYLDPAERLLASISNGVDAAHLNQAFYLCLFQGQVYLNALVTCEVVMRLARKLLGGMTKTKLRKLRAAVLVGILTIGTAFSVSEYGFTKFADLGFLRILAGLSTVPLAVATDSWSQLMFAKGPVGGLFVGSNVFFDWIRSILPSHTPESAALTLGTISARTSLAFQNAIDPTKLIPAFGALMFQAFVELPEFGAGRVFDKDSRLFFPLQLTLAAVGGAAVLGGGIALEEELREWLILNPTPFPYWPTQLRPEHSKAKSQLIRTVATVAAITGLFVAGGQLFREDIKQTFELQKMTEYGAWLEQLMMALLVALSGRFGANTMRSLIQRLLKWARSER